MNRFFAFGCTFVFILLTSASVLAATITSINPLYAMPGESVTISGTGFADPIEVRFNGVKDATANKTGSTTINAHVPAGATSGFVTVKIGNNQPVASPEEFIVIGPGPYIHDFTPAGGGPGTTVTLNGTHFNGSSANITLRLNGAVVPISTRSSEQITFNVPNGATTGKISVTRTNISYTNQTLFYVTPVITGFSPTFGRAGTNVTIRGTNFTGVTLVKFGNTPATSFWITNNNVIGAIVPVGASAGILEIRNPALDPAITSSNFIIQPTVSGFTPGFGQIGTSVTVTGANFNVGTPAVRFGRVLASSVSSVTFNSLVAVVPNGAITAAITVSNAHGTNMSSQLFYMPPRIVSFTPTNGPAGTRVTITGTNFIDTSAISFNGVPAPNFWVTNNGVIGVDVPEGVLTGPIYLTTPHSTTNTVDKFFYGAPAIFSFTPLNGNPDTVVKITGTNLLRATAVSFGGVPAAGFWITNNGTIGAKVPAGFVTGPISVTTPSGTVTSGTQFFYGAPKITNIAPNHGLPGTTVTLSGANFEGVTSVSFNGTAAPNFWVTNNNTIGVQVPAGVATGPISVTTPFYTTNSTQLFYGVPLLSSFTPNRGSVGTNVTLIGTNFTGATAVAFNGIPAPSFWVTNGGIIGVLVPAGFSSGPITITTPHGTISSGLELFHGPPSITGFTPNQGDAGANVALSGSNFLGATAISFNGTVAPSFWITNNNKIGVVVPAGVVTGPISITTPHSSISSTGLFFAAPIVTGFTPSSGLPGTNVLILGTNFTGVTSVKFNGTNAAFSVTNGILRAIVPTNATTGPISIAAPAGTATSAASFVLEYTSDLGVSISAPASVELGNDYTYVITVTNRGGFAAPDVMFTNTLPGNVAFKLGSSTRGTLMTSGNKSWVSMGTLNANTKATITIVVTAQANGNAQDLATVVSSLPDPNPADNSAVANTLIFVIPVIDMQLVTTGGNQLRLAWPAVLGDYVLESTTNLSAELWSEVLTDPEFIGDQKVVTEPIGTESKFYRLRQN